MRDKYDDLPYYRLVEECFRAYVELPSKIARLQDTVDGILPPSPRMPIRISRLKKKIKSDTEKYGILRAEGNEALELYAKMALLDALTNIRNRLSMEQLQIVTMRYDNNEKDYRVMATLHMSQARYYREKRKIIIKAWEWLRLLAGAIELATK